MKKRVTQNQVNVIHRLAAEGVSMAVIARRFSVTQGTVSYVLSNRPATSTSSGETCSRCKGSFGSRRVVRLAGHTFCDACREWVFANPHLSAHQFKGIF